MLGPEVLALFKQRGFSILTICLALIAIPSGFYYSFVNPFLNEIGMENTAGKMSLGQVSEIVFMLLLPFFFTRFSFKWVIALGFAGLGYAIYFYLLMVISLSKAGCSTREYYYTVSLLTSPF
jgi:hypothetical protein